VKTNDLIAALSDNLPPVPSRAGLAPLVWGLGAGMLVSAALMVVWLGLRPDLAEAMRTPPFWMKFGYTLAFAALAFWATLRLAHPGAPARTAMRAMLLPVTAMAALGLLELALSRTDSTQLFYGSSHQVCPQRIFVVSLPIFLGALWGLRRLAPTRLALTGAIAGLLAGAAGAWIYAFHCGESGALFVSVWYTLGIASVGVLGALLGRLVLRW
jgi:hypothetical protein